MSSDLKWFKLLRGGVVVHGGWRADAPPWPDGPGPLADFEWDEAIEVDRPGDPRAETWDKDAGFALCAAANAGFERDIDRLAEAALNPRPAISVIQMYQASEARRFQAEGSESPDLAADYPNLHAQALAFFADMDTELTLAEQMGERAVAILDGFDRAVKDDWSVNINAKRLALKEKLRNAPAVPAKIAVVEAFRDWLADL